MSLLLVAVVIAEVAYFQNTPSHLYLAWYLCTVPVETLRKKIRGCGLTVKFTLLEEVEQNRSFVHSNLTTDVTYRKVFGSMWGILDHPPVRSLGPTFSL